MKIAVLLETIRATEHAKGDFQAVLRFFSASLYFLRNFLFFFYRNLGKLYR
jgi:hypothetical protein